MPVGVAGAVVGAGLSAYGAEASNKANKSATAAYNAPLEQAISQAQSVSQQPYQQYTGQLTAPISSNEQNAATLAGTRASEATTAFNAASTPFSSSALAQYMNPYTQDVTKAGLNTLNQNFNTQNEQALRKANMTDQFGYGRTAASMQPALNAYQNEVGNFTANENAKAYQSALNEFNQQGAFQKGLGEAEGNASTSGVGALESTGKDLREAGTQADQAQYGEFLRGQNWSRNQIQPYLSAVESLGPKLQQPTQSNVLTSAIGGAMSGYGLGSILGSGLGGGGPSASSVQNTANSSLPGLAASGNAMEASGDAGLNDEISSSLQSIAGDGT